jgi:hypothetical protein
MLRTLSLFAICTLLGLPAVAAEEKAKPDAKDNQPRIKVFRLQVAEPNDVLQAFNALAENTPHSNPPRQRFTPEPVPVPRPLPELPPIGGPRFESSEEPVTFQDPQIPPPPTPATGAVIGQATGATTGSASGPVICRAVADQRTRSLIVRGTAKDLQLAADVVAVLDTAEDKPLPGVTSLKAFRLKHVDAVDLVGILQALDDSITYRLAPVGRMKLLLATGTDEQMKELADAVKELDIPAK